MTTKKRIEELKQAGHASGTAPIPITVLDATYIANADNEPAKFIGLWYSDANGARLLLFPLHRKDILAAENGDKGMLTRNGNQWDFIPRGH